MFNACSIGYNSSLYANRKSKVYEGITQKNSIENVRLFVVI